MSNSDRVQSKKIHFKTIQFEFSFFVSFCNVISSYHITYNDIIFVLYNCQLCIIVFAF